MGIDFEQTWTRHFQLVFKSQSRYIGINNCVNLFVIDMSSNQRDYVGRGVPVDDNWRKKRIDEYNIGKQQDIAEKRKKIQEKENEAESFKSEFNYFVVSQMQKDDEIDDLEARIKTTNKYIRRLNSQMSSLYFAIFLLH